MDSTPASLLFKRTRNARPYVGVRGVTTIRTAVLILLLSASALAQSVGQVVPDFAFQRLNGDPVSLQELQKDSPSGVVMLTFWCTTCNSCRASEGPLSQLSKKFSDRATVVAVSASRQDNSDTVSNYLRRKKMKMPVLRDPRSDLARHFKVKRTTTTLLIDSDGRLRYIGTLKKGSKFYAQNALKSVLTKKIVGTPVGPSYG